MEYGYHMYSEGFWYHYGVILTRSLLDFLAFNNIALRKDSTRSHRTPTPPLYKKNPLKLSKKYINKVD